MNIQVKKLKYNAQLPTRGSAYAAGYDLYACLDEAITIAAGETVKVGTGLSIAVPEGYFGAIFARSGLAAKEGLRPANCVGVADSDYRGEYIVALHNDSSVTRTVTPGERIAQLVIMPFLSINFEEAQELDATERGEGGFGSTGKYIYAFCDSFAISHIYKHKNLLYNYSKNNHTQDYFRRFPLILCFFQNGKNFNNDRLGMLK